MLYKSTRGGLQKLTFEDILFAGILDDGGLAIPEQIPVLPKAVLNDWAKLSYKEIVEQIIRIYVSEEEISKSKLKEIITLAYRKFDIPEVIQTKCLEKNLFVAELFHGPTLSFKDLALSVVGQLLEHFLEKRKKHINIVVATSGDTGSSAIESVRGLKWVDIIVLYPKGRITPLQELQMITVCDCNVTCIAVERSCDELDVAIRECFADQEFCRSHNLCSINSINWTRLMIQIAHYFYLYLKNSPEANEEVTFIVPTGSAGNVTAGFIAKSMGLPIKLVSTVNRNDVLYRALRYGNTSQRDVIQTYAVAMDTQAPSNLERILYLAEAESQELLSTLIKQFYETGSIVIPDKTLKVLRKKWQVETFDDDAILRSIKACWNKYGYLICPHTATGIAYCIFNGKENAQSAATQVCLGTASPLKFPETGTAAGVPCDLSLKEKLAGLETKCIQKEASENITMMLKNIIERSTIMKTGSGSPSSC